MGIILILVQVQWDSTIHFKEVTCSLIKRLDTSQLEDGGMILKAHLKLRLCLILQETLTNPDCLETKVYIQQQEAEDRAHLKLHDEAVADF